MLRATAYILLLCLLAPATATAQLGAPQKISATEGDPRGRAENTFELASSEVFGPFVSEAGDVDGDGIVDLALGTSGAVWILFMDARGTIKNYRKTSQTDLDIPVVPGGGIFPNGLASLGDFDDDGVPDLVALNGFSNTTWILYLNRDGTVKRVMNMMNGQPPDLSMDINADGRKEIVAAAGLRVTIMFLSASGTVEREQQICNWDLGGGEEDDVCREGGFTGEEFFGGAAANLDDFDDNGVPDLAVGGGQPGRFGTRDGCPPGNTSCEKGNIWILFLRNNGAVERHQKISSTEGGFTGVLSDTSGFGLALTSLGDLDGDGLPELVAGTRGDDDGGRDRGAVWILSLNTDGTVKRHQKISSTEGGFTGVLENGDRFGSGVTTLSDLDGDGLPELLVEAGDDEGGSGFSGAYWILWLHPDGTVRRHHKIIAPDFLFTLAGDDAFGSAQASLGDLDSDGTPELAVGAPGTDDGGTDRGALWLLSLNTDGTPQRNRKISARAGSFTGVLADGDRFGSAVASLGDLDGDGAIDLASGAPGNDQGRGAIWTLLLDGDGQVKTHMKITAGEGGFTGLLGEGDAFGSSIASLSDLDDTVADLVIGAPGSDTNQGAAWLLSLDTDGTAHNTLRIAPGEGGFSETLAGGDAFGSSVTSLGDLDGDGIPDMAISAPGSDEGRGAVYVLHLHADGSVQNTLKITDGRGGFSGSLAAGDHFGSALSSPGDLDGDGIPDLIVSANGDNAGRGAFYVLFLNPDGSVKTQRSLDAEAASLAGLLDQEDRFGTSVTSLGDLDLDGLPDLAVGATGDDDGCPPDNTKCNTGALWVVPGIAFLSASIDSLAAVPASPILGETIDVSAQITDPNGITSATLSFRAAGTPSFSTTLMNQGADGAFNATIPPLLSPQGIEYFVTATNPLGASVRQPLSGVTSLPVHLPEGLSTELPSGTAAAGYRLLSIPMTLDNPSALAVFEDDLGPYEKSRWRFFEHNTGTVFVELDVGDRSLELGRAYWLLVQEPGQRLTTGPGTSVKTDVPFPVALKSGWNLVGSPFNFSVPVEQLSTASGQAIEIWGYDGSWSPLEEALVPFSGYAVFNARSGEEVLWIDPDLSPDAAGTSSQRELEAEASLDWSIRIVAQQGQARDGATVAGVSSLASAGWDALDRPEPPVVGDYVQVSFPHAAWKRNTARYSTDVRPMTEAGETRWTFDVETRRSGRVALRFEGLDEVPASYEVWLVDDVVGLQQDLRVEPHYALVSGGVGQVRTLTLVVSKGALTEEQEPSRFELFQNFPNPFTAATTLRYGLPEASSVRLAVYDVLGRRVAVLVEETMPAGRHAVVWDGRSDSGVPVGSGLYVVRLQAGRFAQTRTMVIVR